MNGSMYFTKELQSQPDIYSYLIIAEQTTMKINHKYSRSTLLIPMKASKKGNVKGPIANTYCLEISFDKGHASIICHESTN